jgi:hypothetical protein
VQAKSIEKPNNYAGSSAKSAVSNTSKVNYSFVSHVSFFIFMMYTTVNEACIYNCDAVRFF